MKNQCRFSVPSLLGGPCIAPAPARHMGFAFLLSRLGRAAAQGAPFSFPAGMNADVSPGFGTRFCTPGVLCAKSP